VSQTLLKITCPGVPDTYQGTELFDLSLVDPDNRRPVDYSFRRQLLEELDGATSEGGNAVPLCDDLMRDYTDGRIKLWTTARALCFRREHAQLFQTGTYHPITAQGQHSGHVVAFTREHRRELAVVVAPRLAYTLMRGEERPPLGAVWADTAITLPRASSQFLNVFTGEVLTSTSARTLLCSEVFGHFPVALLLAV
jgi:(1->4)-alpha-D-glucan 1-alpha-D-glucosylmutase